MQKLEKHIRDTIKLLGEDASILNESPANKVINKFESLVKFESYGINWSLLTNQVKLKEFKDALPLIEKRECYVIWDKYTLPVVKSNINKIERNINDITMLAFDTYFVSKDFDWFIEHHHEAGFRYSKLGNVTST